MGPEEEEEASAELVIAGSPPKAPKSGRGEGWFGNRWEVRCVWVWRVACEGRGTGPRRLLRINPGPQIEAPVVNSSVAIEKKQHSPRWEEEEEEKEGP